MKTYQSNIKAFSMRETNKNDAELVFNFIYKLAIYENMTDVVTATYKDIEKSIFEDHKAEVLLAYENDVPIGICLFHENYSTFMGQANMYIEDIFIEEQYRHQGYGTEIFNIIKQIAKERSYGRVDWVCLDWNTPSIDFYKKMGAKPLNEWILFRLYTYK